MWPIAGEKDAFLSAFSLSDSFGIRLRKKAEDGFDSGETPLLWLCQLPSNPRPGLHVPRVSQVAFRIYLVMKYANDLRRLPNPKVSVWKIEFNRPLSQF